MFSRLFRNVVYSSTKFFKYTNYYRFYSKDLSGNFSGLKNLNFKKNKSKNIISLSENALNRLYEIISDSNKVVYLCLKVKGCNGYVYEMNLVDTSTLKDMDELIYDNNGKLVLAIENKATFYLLGSNIDYAENDLSEGFIFDNPNVTSQCGCGMSFRF